MFGDDLFDMNHPFNKNMEKYMEKSYNHYKEWQKLNQKIQNNRPNEPRVTYVYIRQTKLISTKRNLSQLS